MSKMVLFFKTIHKTLKQSYHPKNTWLQMRKDVDMKNKFNAAVSPL